MNNKKLLKKLADGPLWETPDKFISFFLGLCEPWQVEMFQKFGETKNYEDPKVQNIVRQFDDLCFVQSLYDGLGKHSLCSFNCIAKEVQETRVALTNEDIDFVTLCDVVYLFTRV